MELVVANLEDLRGEIAHAFEQRAAAGPLSCGVSGGPTALIFLAALRAAEVDWSRVTLFMVDERAGASEAGESRAEMTRNPHPRTSARGAGADALCHAGGGARPRGRRGRVQLLRVPGLGTKKAQTLWKELGITTLGELEYAIRENRLLSLPGFGEKSQQRLGEGLRFVRSTEGRARLPEAWEQASRPHGSSSSRPPRDRRASSWSRSRVTSEGAARPSRRSLSSTRARGPRGSRRSRARSGALPVTVSAGPKEDFGNRLLGSTGSDAHLCDLESRDASGALRFPSFEESALYERLRLEFVPPELREGLDAKVISRMLTGLD